jgi:hypothetical protein
MSHSPHPTSRSIDRLERSEDSHLETIAYESKDVADGVEPPWHPTARRMVVQLPTGDCNSSTLLVLVEKRLSSPHVEASSPSCYRRHVDGEVRQTPSSR